MKKCQRMKKMKSVLTNREMKELTMYAIKLQRVFGPQEVEWAVLTSRQVIFQDTRNSAFEERISFEPGVTVICSGEAEGEAVFLNEIRKAKNLKNKILVTDNLDISFITSIAYQIKPRAVILTRGSLTAHATTILREAKIPTLLVKKVNIKNGDMIRINKNGLVEFMK